MHSERAVVCYVGDCWLRAWVLCGCVWTPCRYPEGPGSQPDRDHQIRSNGSRDWRTRSVGRRAVARLRARPLRPGHWALTCAVPSAPSTTSPLALHRTTSNYPFLRFLSPFTSIMQSASLSDHHPQINLWLMLISRVCWIAQVGSGLYSENRSKASLSSDLCLHDSGLAIIPTDKSHLVS